ncbi:MAG TPA: efflux RND transporter periplasmic adaptor subunit, partial [Cyanobacteria bacterium UBA11372]|nr:efflux RND transporter periplasmic adaptor subunit [Cyanobacteria bacterium UBA11372]
MTTRLEPLHPNPWYQSFRKQLQWRWLIGLLLLGGIAGGGFTLYRALPRSQTAQSQILTAAIEQKTLPITFSANGTVKPERTINLSPKTSGVLKELLVKEGDRITAGQIVARMDNSNLQGQLIQAQAQLTAAQANLNKLLAGNRPQEIAQVQAQLTSAQANLNKLQAGNRPQEIAQVQAQLTSAQANLNKLLAGNRPQEIAQVQAQLTSAQANLNKLLAGNRPQEIAQVQAQLAAAQANLQQAQINLNQNQRLYTAGAISQRDLDTSRTAYATARAQVDQLQQALNLEKSGTRTEEIAQARAQVEQFQQALKLAQAGTRPEEIAQARAQVEQFQQALKLAQAGTRPEEIAQARAQVEQFQQALKLAQAGTRPEEIAQAQAQVESARGALQTIQTQINDATIKAPFDGVVTKKYADPGSFVTPTTAGSNSEGAASNSILTLAATNQVVAYLDEAKISRIQVGQPVKITADAFGDRIFSGTVAQVAAQATTTQNVTSFEVRVSLEPAAQQLLKSGMSVEAQFQVGQLDNAILAPSAAIVRQQNGSTGVYLTLPDLK